MTTTYTLSEVATDLDLHKFTKNPVRWLTKEIKDKRITARRLGRSWGMTQADVDAALEVWASRNKPVQIPDSVPRIGLSAASARRRSA